MKAVVDLHTHSPYSRAVSPQMTIPNLDEWGRKKGIKVIGSGDFTHPKWMKHLQENLETAEPGLYKYKSGDSGVRFMITTEISSIYSHKGKTRRVHNLIFAPSLEIAEEITKKMDKKGAKLASDGRPITGISSRELLNLVLEVSEDCLFVPAHAWTPWFAVFGSKSGYDSLEECFEKDAKYVYAIETGLSSDKKMNWRLSALDNITLISNSDPHSLHRLGREANVLEIEEGNLSYQEIARIIREKDNKKFLYTIEYFPEEGRYHYDGDRKHNVSLHPQESKKLKQRCPKCAKPLTVGVLSRVEELADRPEGFVPEGAIPEKHFIPLEEIIADALGMKTVTSKTVMGMYDQMVEKVSGGELEILTSTHVDKIADISNELIAEGVSRVREEELSIKPGYDGVYGEIEIFTDEEREKFEKKGEQETLF